MKLSRAALAAALLCCASPALAQDQIAQVLAAGPPSTSVDLTALAATAGQWAIWALGAVALALVRTHVTNQGARDTLSAAILNGVNYGFNLVPGALKGKVLSVDAGSKVAAQALRYVLDAGGAEAKRLKLGPADLAKRILARIPGIDGEIAGDIAHQVAAAAAGSPPPIDPMKAAALLEPLAEKLAQQLLPGLAGKLEALYLAHNGEAAINSGQQDSGAAFAAIPPAPQPAAAPAT